MKTSLVLYSQEMLEKHPYLHYIYNAIIELYQKKGSIHQVSFQEATYQKLATGRNNTSLITISLSAHRSLKRGLWERLNFPALLRQLQPGNVYVIGEPISLKNNQQSGRWWYFIYDGTLVDLLLGKQTPASKKRIRFMEKLAGMDRIISYSPVATEAMKEAVPQFKEKLRTWMPLPDRTYLDPKRYTDDQIEAFRLKATGEESYFLLDARASSQDGVIEHLKAFSHFKKWQRSSMNMGLLISPSLMASEHFREIMDTYFYKKDVQLLSDLNKDELYYWIRAAYAVISPCFSDQGLDIQLAAACLATLVIAPATPTTEALLAGARYPLADIDKESLGQVMISSYKAEILRSRHIKAGLECAEKWPAMAGDLME